MSDFDPKPKPDQDPDMTRWGAGPTGAAPSRPAPSHQQATKLSSDPEATIAPGGSRPPSPASFIVTSHAVLFSPGTVLGGRYEIVAQLGMGGMGAVYKAYDREVQRDIALKVIRPELAENPQILQRFKQELILAREVTHPNVVRIYDIGEAEGVKFITMKFVQGQDLASLMTDGKGMEPNRAADIIYQVCEGLEAVHKQGIIHRDLKPGNIMLDEQGRVVLMDFGLARGVEGEGMTQTGAMLGTMQYMSPEQAKAEPLDQRSDIYTVGLIFYEMLTGVSPYASESAITSLMKRTQERAKPVSTFVQGIPPALNDICSRCLEINPAHRFQSIGELLAAFDAWRGGIAPSQISMVARRVQRRFSWKYAAAVCALVILIAASAVLIPRLRLSETAGVGGEHAPVSVLVADFANQTGDPELDNTLEPMLNLALEGAKFISAFDRGDARMLAGKLPHPTNKLDEQASRLIAYSQGIDTVITGILTRRDKGYKLALEALDSRTGKSIASSDVMAPTKDELLKSLPKLAAPIRKALGDVTPVSAQLNEVAGAFTAASLEVVHLDALAMEQQFAGKNKQALETFSKAVQLDPNFARAYTGMSGAAANLGNLKEAETYINKAMEHQDRMTERERYRYRELYYAIVGDWQKCADEGTQLIKRYPADRVGQTNLSACLGELRQIPKAVEAARRAVEIVPKGALQRQNLSYFSTVGGDFTTGVKQAEEAIGISPSSEPSYLALAEAHLGQGDVTAAADAYHKLEKMSEVGASTAQAGLADLAIYEGRFSEAEKILEASIAADLKAKRQDVAAAKYATLAFSELARGEKRKAVAETDKALANSQGVGVRFLVARILVEAGELAKAEKLAKKLSAEVQAESQAYGKIIQGMAALKRGQAGEGVRLLSDANALLDTWIGHFELGRAYLQAGAFVQADSEFEQCLRRRGEAIELFMDNTPTYGYFPAVYYYQGRVREGMKSSNYRDSYRAYLNIREKAGEDPLLNEVKTRAAQLTASN